MSKRNMHPRSWYSPMDRAGVSPFVLTSDLCAVLLCTSSSEIERLFFAKFLL